jgi:hypothetical protein
MEILSPKKFSQLSSEEQKNIPPLTSTNSPKSKQERANS